MREHLGFTERAGWRPKSARSPGAASIRGHDLHSAIERVQDALDRGSIGRVIHALVALRSVLRSRLADQDFRKTANHERLSIGRWRRRLRRRYAASLCNLERLIEKGWGSLGLDAIRPALGGELAKLRRIESLENEAQLALSWTDIGVGD